MSATVAAKTRTRTAHLGASDEVREASSTVMRLREGKPNSPPKQRRPAGVQPLNGGISWSAREEIIRRLWGKDVFLDTEQDVNTAIRKIRLILGDDPNEPRFLQTGVGKGYRFVGPITVIAGEPTLSRSECWAGLRHSALRSPWPARKRTPWHVARPSEAAEARFTPPQAEFIE